MLPVNIVIFEKFSKDYGSLIEDYLKKGYKIYFFCSDNSYLRGKNFDIYTENGFLVDISSHSFEYELYRKASFYAHENVDAVFSAYYSKSLSIKNIVRSIGNAHLINMYKRQVLLDIEQIYERHLKIISMFPDAMPSKISFYPVKDARFHKGSFSLLPPHITVQEHHTLLREIRRIMDRSIVSLLLFYPVYLLLRIMKITFKSKEKRSFKTGIMIDKNPQSIFLMNYLTESFYIDETELPKEDVIFIDENSAQNINGYRSRGYNFVDPLKDRQTLSWDFFINGVLRSFLPTWIISLFLSLFEDPLITITNRKVLSDYIVWNIFFANYEIKNYVKRMLPDNISKTMIMSDHNVSTWIIFPDNTSIDFHLDWDATKKNQTHFSFMHYDNAIVYGSLVERFFRKHRNFIENYYRNGVIFSQIVRQLQENTLQSPLPAILEKKGMPERIIAVFDTTYVDWGPVRIHDGQKFAKDILQLLTDFPDVGVVFKAMKEPELTPGLSSFYSELEKHERCLVFYRYGKEGISSPEVIAFSDLVISAQYTSPSAESLGARKKALYYDVAGHDIGDKYYYNRYPNFVAHNYEELRTLVNYWLNEVTEKEFDDFLNTYVKDEIDPYLDGQALSRIRKLIRGDPNGK